MIGLGNQGGSGTFLAHKVLCLPPPLWGGHMEDQYYFHQVLPICVFLLLVIQEDFPKKKETFALVVTQHALHIINLFSSTAIHMTILNVINCY